MKMIAFDKFDTKCQIYSFLVVIQSLEFLTFHPYIRLDINWFCIRGLQIQQFIWYYVCGQLGRTVLLITQKVIFICYKQLHWHDIVTIYLQICILYTCKNVSYCTRFWNIKNQNENTHWQTFLTQKMQARFCYKSRSLLFNS